MKKTYNHYKVFFENSNDGIFFLNKKMYIFEPSKRAVEYLSIDKDDNFNLYCQLKKNFHINEDISIKKIKTPLKIKCNRIELEHFPPLFLEITITNNFINDVPYPYIGIIQDVTKNEIEDDSRHNFLSLISHKLRTPMLALAYSMNLVKQRAKLNFSENETDDFIEQAHFKTLEISEIFEKIIHYCSAYRDKIHSKNDSFKLLELIEKSIERCERKHKLINQNFSLSVHYDSNLNYEIKMPKEQATLIFDAIIDNSVKFNYSATKKLIISAVKEHDKIKLSFSDNGAGIPSEYHSKVFDTFFQLEKYFTGMVDGVGLGLPLAKKILSLYGQNIELTSKVKHGTKITITLPIL